MDKDLDVSHITGISRQGAYNDWTTWHSEVNKQTPLFLNGRYQPIKPSVSLNAGANVLLTPKPTTDIQAQPPAPTKPKDDKDKEKPWWETAMNVAAEWTAKNVVFPLIKKVDQDPLNVVTNVINPTPLWGISTIVGGGDPLTGALRILDVPKRVVTSTMISQGRGLQEIRYNMAGEKPPRDFWIDMQDAWNWSLQDKNYVPALDKSGNPVYKKNDDGTPKVLTDEDGQTVYEQYTDGSYVLDDNGEKVPVYEVEMVDTHENIDIGTAWAYLMGQGTGLVTEVGAEVATGGGYGTSDKEREAFRKTMTDWGMVYSNSNFDIFNRDQRDLITGQKRWENGAIVDGSGNGWTPGNVLVQTLNFTGDLATDPLTYVPFGKVGRVMFVGRNLLTNATKQQVTKRIIEDATTLTAAAEGKATVYDNFLNFVANNNAQRISNHVVIRSITSGEKDQVAYLLGQVTTKEDAAKVLLSVEYGSTRATKELLEKYSGISLAIDEQVAGGYIARGISNGKINPVDDLLDANLHQNFYTELSKYGSLIDESPFANVLKETAFKIVDEDGVLRIGPALATRELTPVKIQSLFANKVLSGLEATGARATTFFVNGLDNMNAFSVERPFKFGTKNFWLHQIVRLGSKNAKGIIDVTNLDGMASSKFFGALNDIDRVTKGSFSLTRKDAKGQSYTIKTLLTNKWMSATDPATRAQVIQEANAYGLKVLAEKYGATDAVQDRVVAELMRRNKIHMNNLDTSGVSIMKVNGTSFIYHDPYAIGKGTTEIHLWDWNKVNTEFAKNRSILVKGFVGTQQLMTNIYKEFNSLFNALIVSRPARFGRDILANAITVLGSGYGKDVLLTDLKSIPFALNPIKKLPVNKASMLISKKNIDSSIEAISLLEKERNVLETSVLNRWNYLTSYMTLMPLEKSTLDDVVSLLTANQILTRRSGLHSTIDEIDIIGLDPERPFVSFVNEKDVAEFAVQKHGRPIKVKKLSTQEIVRLTDAEAKEYGGIVIAKPTASQILEMLRSGSFIVHIRVKGRGRKWEVLDKDRFITDIGSINLDKYDFRMFNKSSFNDISENDLLDMLMDRSKKYYTLDGKLLDVKDSRKVFDDNEVILELDRTHKTLRPEYYGTGFDAREVDDEILNTLIEKNTDRKEFFIALQEYLKDPVEAKAKNLMTYMDEGDIGYVVAKDPFGREIVIGNPEYTILDPKAPEAPSQLQEIVSNIFARHNAGFWALGPEQDLRSKARRSILAKMTELQKETLPGTPFLINTKYPFVIDPTTEVIRKAPKKVVLVWGRNPDIASAQNQLFIQLGPTKRVAVRLGWNKETRRPIFQIPSKEKNIPPGATGKYWQAGAPYFEDIAVGTWYEVSALPKVTLGDIFPIDEITNLTSRAALARTKTKTKTALEKVERENLALGEGITEAPRIAESLKVTGDGDFLDVIERAHLESMLSVGSFKPEVLQQIQSQVARYEDVVRQLKYLYGNLEQVSGKLTKAQAKRLEIERKRLGLKPVPAEAPMSTGDTVKDLFADVGYPPQMFANAITGRGGERWYARIRGDARDVRDQGTGFLVRDARIENRIYKPEEGLIYWNAWAKTLNDHWRMPDGQLDPVIRKIIEGQLTGEKDDVLKISIRQWLERTPDGRAYAKSIGVGKEYESVDIRIPVPPRTRFEQMDSEKYIDMQFDNVLQHLGYLSRDTRIGDDVIDLDELINVKRNDIAQKILKDEEVTPSDLQQAWLQPKESVVINRGTDKIEQIGPSTYDVLPEVWGTFADPVGRRSIIDGTKVLLRNMNRIIADTPQEVLFQTPLFHAAYKKSLIRSQEQMRLSTGREFFNSVELRTMEEKARSFALAETRKWVYSAQQQGNIFNGLNLLAPFLNAITFSAKWMKNVATERPVYAAWMLYEYNKAIGNTQWYDKDGNPTSYDAKDTDGRPIATHFRLDYPSWLINTIAGKSQNDPWAKDYIDSTFVSRTSIDPIWSGNNLSLGGVQVPNPFISWGLSPAPAIAVSELVKFDLQNPNSPLGIIVSGLTGGAKINALPDLTKFGVSSVPGSYDYLIPKNPMLKPALDLLFSNGVDPIEVQSMKIKAGIYLYGRWVADPENNPQPNPDLVNAYALTMYDLKNNSSFWLPFATKYVTESDIARSTFQTYLKNEQDLYDRLGPSAYTKKYLLEPDSQFVSYEQRQSALPGAKPFQLDPYTVAISRFMNERPDIFYGAVSTSGGDLKLKPQRTTAQNLTRYNDYTDALSQNDEGIDVLADIINGDSNSTMSATSYVFDQNVYNLLVERKLLGKADPAKTITRVKIAKGNEVFRKGGVDSNGNKVMGMNELDALAFERNVPIEQDPYLKREKQRLVEWISNNKVYGREWAASRSNINPQRYNNYADAWEQVFGEPKTIPGLTKNQLSKPSKPVYRDDVAKNNPTFLESVDAFLYYRNQWQQELRNRSVTNPSLGTLGNNPDIAYQYYNYVLVLKNYDTTGKFAEWYNTYFEGDTVN